MGTRIFGGAFFVGGTAAAIAAIHNDLSQHGSMTTGGISNLIFFAGLAVLGLVMALKRQKPPGEAAEIKSFQCTAITILLLCIGVSAQDSYTVWFPAYE